MTFLLKQIWIGESISLSLHMIVQDEFPDIRCLWLE